MAIEHALTILSWYEHLQQEDQPPEYLWEDDKGLELWWASVDAKREDGSSISRGRTDHAQDDQASPAQATENDYARFLKQ